LGERVRVRGCMEKALTPSLSQRERGLCSADFLTPISYLLTPIF
jgi:hypothetical protein